MLNRSLKVGWRVELSNSIISPDVKQSRCMRRGDKYGVPRVGRRLEDHRRHGYRRWKRVPWSSEFVGSLITVGLRSKLLNAIQWLALRRVVLAWESPPMAHIVVQGVEHRSILADL
jgi:hypothetical protein